MNTINTDKVHEARCNFVRYFKGGMVELLSTGGEVNQLNQILGEGFNQFARIRLGLSPAETAFFLRLSQTPGLDAAQFLPDKAVSMARLLEALGVVVATYAAVAGDAAVILDAPTADSAPTQDCKGPVDTTGVTSATATSDTTRAGAGDAASETTPVRITTAVATPVNDVAADDGVTGPATTDTVSVVAAVASQSTAPVEHDQLPAEASPTVAVAPAAHCSQLTAEQHRSLRERSVTLLLKVNKGELTVEQAMRQAEGMPKRKAK